MKNFDLKSKNAVIFGVRDERSIAWHIAKTLNNEGVRIAVAYQERNKESVKPLLNSLRNSFGMVCDVTDDGLLDEFFKKVSKEFNKIDFLIHSIAFAKKENLQGKFLDIDRKGYNISQEVSAYSLIELAKRTYSLMNKGGSIIAMTSIGSQRVFPNYNIMGVSKAALESSVRYLAYDLGEKKIRVNAVSFAPINTGAASGISGFREHLEHHKNISPLKRNINQEDVSNLVLFLCSDLSRNITGQVIFVDAGFSIMC